MEELPTPITATTPAPGYTLGQAEGDAAIGFGGAMDIDEDEVNAWGQPVGSADDYMLKLMTSQLKDTPLELPKDRSRSKRGKDHRHRPHRVR